MFSWLLLAFSPFSGSERSPPGSLYPLGYLQPEPAATFVKFLEVESSGTETTMLQRVWRKVWYKCLGPSVPWDGIIIIVAALGVLLIPLGTQSILEMWLSVSLYMGPRKRFVWFFLFFSVLAVQSEFAETEINQTRYFNAPLDLHPCKC